MVEKASLYIHIPFCSSKCDYCDFYSVRKDSVNNDLIDLFLNALINDIKYQIEYLNVKEIPTVYIGGGTPSVLGTKIKVLFETLNKMPDFSPEEFTIEVNPESVTEEFLEICKDGGINRISLGVQTFHEPSRVAVNRGENDRLSADLRGLTQKEDGIKLASKYFPGSLSIDLITGLPYQDESVVTEDIKRVLDFNPVHVSLYSLSVEKGTPLESKIKSKKVFLPDSEIADSLWLTGRDALLKAGFEHYEISNFTKPGSRCLHNYRYWQMLNWIGAGPAASGTIVNEKDATARRFTYNCDIREYINKPFVNNAIYEELDKKALLKENLLMGFRCKEGPDRDIFKQRFSCAIEDCIPKTLTRWKNKDKMLFLNAFLTEAFEEIDSLY